MSSRGLVVVLICLAGGAMLRGADAFAKIYQCKVAGRTVYTDQPCGGLGSESENLYVSPSRQTAGDAQLPPVVPGQEPKPARKSTPTQSQTRTQTAPRAGKPPVADSPSPQSRSRRGAARVTAVPGAWRLAAEYSDRIPDAGGQGTRRMVARSSYGIECETGGHRRRIYAIDGRFSLLTPASRGALNASAPLFESLDAAATAACATAESAAADAAAAEAARGR